MNVTRSKKNGEYLKSTNLQKTFYVLYIKVIGVKNFSLAFSSYFFNSFDLKNNAVGNFSDLPLHNRNFCNYVYEPELITQINLKVKVKYNVCTLI